LRVSPLWGGVWVGVNGSTPSSSRDWNGRVVLEKGSSGIEEGHLSDRRVFIEESSSLRQEAPETGMEGLSLKKVRAASKRGTIVAPCNPSSKKIQRLGRGIRRQEIHPPKRRNVGPHAGLQAEMRSRLAQTLGQRSCKNLRCINPGRYRRAYLLIYAK